jgi:hypothetical protein
MIAQWPSPLRLFLFLLTGSVVSNVDAKIFWKSNTQTKDAFQRRRLGYNRKDADNFSNLPSNHHALARPPFHLSERQGEQEWSTKKSRVVGKNDYMVLGKSAERFVKQILSPTRANRLETTKELHSRIPILHKRKPRRDSEKTFQQTQPLNAFHKAVEATSRHARNLQSDGLRACDELKESEELAGASVGTRCDCTSADGGSTTLQCTDEKCLFCRNDHSVCEAFLYGSILDSLGTQLATFTQNDYIVGRSDSVRFVTASDTCSVTVNGIPCRRCSFATCDDGRRRAGVSLECSNVPDAAAFSTCDSTFFTNGVKSSTMESSSTVSRPLKHHVKCQSEDTNR